MKRSIQSALFLLFMISLCCMSACGGKRQPELRNADEGILLSNITFEGMEMSEAQDQALQIGMITLIGHMTRNCFTRDDLISVFPQFCGKLRMFN